MPGLCRRPSDSDCCPDVGCPRTLATTRVSYQCHTNCDEWRQMMNKKFKEKVNLATPI
jgi:hypothetical protein